MNKYEIYNMLESLINSGYTDIELSPKHFYLIKQDTLMKSVFKNK